MGADWQTLATLHILVGYEADLLGLVRFKDARGREAVEGLLIAAFIFYTFVALVVALQKWADCKLPEKIITIINIILLILAGLLLIAGVAIAEGKRANAYSSGLEVIGALLAIISAVFLILSLVCGGGSKTSPA